MKPGFLGTEKKIVVVVGVGVVSQEERRRKLETDGRRGYMPNPARPSHQGEKHGQPREILKADAR